jgi:hypothetical protein
LRSVKEAAAELSGISEEEILETVREIPLGTKEAAGANRRCSHKKKTASRE